MTRTTMTFWVFSSHQKSSPVGIRCPLPFPPTSPPSSRRQPLVYFLPQFWTFHIKRTIQHVFFSYWPLSSGTLCWSFICGGASICISFSLLNDIPLYGFITLNLSIYLLMGFGGIAMFWLSSITALWIFVCKCFHGHVLFLLGT